MALESSSTLHDELNTTTGGAVLSRNVKPDTLGKFRSRMMRAGENPLPRIRSACSPSIAVVSFQANRVPRCSGADPLVAIFSDGGLLPTGVPRALPADRRTL